VKNRINELDVDTCIERCVSLQSLRLSRDVEDILAIPMICILNCVRKELKIPKKHYQKIIITVLANKK